MDDDSPNRESSPEPNLSSN
jgi:hypothetical protein